MDSVAAESGMVRWEYATANVAWTLTPGTFSLASTTALPVSAVEPESLEIGLAQAVDVTSVTFGLGDVRNTTKYQFILQNGGDLPITDILLSTSDPSVEIFPTVISELGSSETTTIVPIVTVTVVHGTPSSGIGQAPILTQGAHQEEMVLRGVTVTERLLQFSIVK